jgi:hypothetical protein
VELSRVTEPSEGSVLATCVHEPLYLRTTVARKILPAGAGGTHGAYPDGYPAVSRLLVAHLLLLSPPFPLGFANALSSGCAHMTGLALRGRGRISLGRSSGAFLRRSAQAL